MGRGDEKKRNGHRWGRKEMVVGWGDEKNRNGITFGLDLEV